MAGPLGEPNGGPLADEDFNALVTEMLNRPLRRRSRAEKEKSLIKSALRGGLSALEYTGETLDKPGRAVRGSINFFTGGKAGGGLLNLVPFSDTVGLTDPQEGVTGRDLLEHLGMDANKETGLHPIDDPAEAARDTAGLGTEILLDPLTYGTLGLSALGKGGKIAKAAGLLDDAAKIGKVAGKGSRVSRMTTSLYDVLKNQAAQATGQTRRGALEAAQRAAEASGTKLTDVWREPLGGIANVGLPFTAGKLVGTGPLAQKAFGLLDTVADKARWSAPGRLLAQAFHAPVRDTWTRVGQEAATELARNQELARSGVLAKMAERLQFAKDQGLTGDAAGNQLRQMFESYGPVHPKLQPLYGDVTGELADELKRAQELGIDVSQFGDEANIGYFPRHVTSAPNRTGMERHAFNTLDGGQAGRQSFLRGILGGTDTLKQIISDPDVLTAVDTAAARKHIVTKYGPLIVGKDRFDRIESLADWARSLPPETSVQGAFANHPLMDLQHHRLGREDAIASADALLGVVAKHAQPVAAYAPGSETKTVRDILSNAGLVAGDANGGALRAIAIKQGFDPITFGMHGNNMPLDLLHHRIPLEIADDLQAIMRPLSGPAPVNSVLNGKYGVDSLTHLFKAGVLTRPARYVRDLMSGQVQNVLSQQFSPATVSGANRLVRGKLIEGAEQYPLVKQMLAERGVPATPGNATKIVQELLYSQEIGGKHEAKMIGSPGTPPITSLDEMLANLPGHSPFEGVRATVKQALPRSREQANPLNVRGFAGRTESTFAPAVAGEAAGHFTDAMNRIAPFLHKLERGIDPGQAAREVGAAQVNYGTRHFTRTEQQVLKRLFPFYSFTRGMLPHTVGTLAGNPGGPLAQLLRTSKAGRAEGEVVPDHLQDTALLPMGRLPDGSNRYLTGFGLMHEDPLSLLGSNPKQTGLELLSRLNPLVKGPLEGLTGQSFFQKGPEGGRPLRELDPTIGRTLANMLGRGTDGEPVAVPSAVELIGANSPASALLTIARQLSDPRKGIGNVASNLLTGIRTTDVSPAAQNAVLQKLNDEQAREMGAKHFERLSFPKQMLAKMSPREREAAKKYQVLAKMLTQRSKQNVKRRAAEKRRKQQAEQVETTS